MTPQGRTVWFSVAAMAAMVGLVVVSVPLYRLFCKVTGYGGQPRIVADQPQTGTGKSQVVMTIRFDANLMHDVPWRFRPAQNSLQTRLGENQLAVFVAENLSDQPITGTATFNVTPLKAAPYVDKIACFCFSAQRLEPGQKVEMPVSFHIDPAIADNPDTNDVHTITLSYTFFKMRTQPPAKDPARNGQEGRS